jgi:hypothetical protein
MDFLQKKLHAVDAEPTAFLEIAVAQAAAAIGIFSASKLLLFWSGAT